jgi:hypothetical protein
MRPWIIAGSFGVVWLLFMLAGSDIPPPPGFAFIILGIALLVLLIGFATPWLWRMQESKGPGRVLGISLAMGAGIGILLAAIFAIKGSGEPSLPPMPLGAYLIWFVVVTFAGLVNGALVGGVTVLAKPRTNSA